MPRRKLTEAQESSIARFNALRHGFAARRPVLPDVESEADWKRHLRRMTQSLAPEGYFEELLVRRIATALWELDRLTTFQVAATVRKTKNHIESMIAFSGYLATSEDATPDEYEVRERIQTMLLPDRQDMEIVMRYGGQLHRQWIQLHNQLLAVQARRRGERVPLGFLDITAPPANLGPWSPSSSSQTKSSPPPEPIIRDVEARVARAERALKTTTAFSAEAQSR